MPEGSTLVKKFNGLEIWSDNDKNFEEFYIKEESGKLWSEDYYVFRHRIKKGFWR